METLVRKGRDGWEAKSEIQLDNDRVLTITTRKSTSSASLSTWASVSICKDGFTHHLLFQDFSKGKIGRAHV